MRIILVRPDGIGDQILSIPVAHRIKEWRPDTHITFLSSPLAAPVMENLSDIDEVLTATLQDPIGELIRKFKHGFDAAVFLKPYRRLLFAAFCARVPARVASGYRWHSFLANRRIYQHRKHFTKHEAAYNTDLLQGLGIEPGSLKPPNLILTPSERRWADNTTQSLPAKRVVIHPGGISTRKWETRHYVSVANQLCTNGFGVILTGSEIEGEALDKEIASNYPLDPSILNLMGSISLRQLMAVIGASDVVVSGSTGPAHLAAGLGTKTVSLYDPRRGQLPVRWAPLGQGAILRPDVPTCGRCSYEACRYWDCLNRISPSDVVQTVQRVIRGASDMQIIHV